LEKIRYGNKLDLHIHLPQQTDGIFIAPLLMLPFVENCFKHGASHILEQPWISLDITLSCTTLQMKLINGKAAEQTAEQPSAKGIGIINAQTRLDLLYPSKHTLRINNEADIFVVDLTLELEGKETSTIAPLPIAYNHA
jgi:LytS/YehU family sensor histidine kinase